MTLPTPPAPGSTLIAPPTAEKPKEKAPIRGEWSQVDGRDIAALLDPRPTIIVGSVGRRDSVGLATIIWATPISHNPAMVAFALRERSHTMGCIKMNGAFTLNVLPATEEGIYLCEQCGTRTGHRFNKITVVDHRIIEVEYDKTETIEVEVPKQGLFGKATVEEAERTTHHVSKLPVVDAATSWLACSVERIEEAGDHLLVIGNVLEAHTCAVRNKKGELIPQDVLQCVQHGCYGGIEIIENEYSSIE